MNEKEKKQIIERSDAWYDKFKFTKQGLEFRDGFRDFIIKLCSEAHQEECVMCAEIVLPERKKNKLIQEKLNKRITILKNALKLKQESHRKEIDKLIETIEKKTQRIWQIKGWFEREEQKVQAMTESIDKLIKRIQTTGIQNYDGAVNWIVEELRQTLTPLHNGEGTRKGGGDKK